jgi:hypothetical protein
VVIQILHLCANHETQLPFIPVIHLEGLNIPFQETEMDMCLYNFNNLSTTVMRDAVSFCYGSRQQERRSQERESNSYK